MIFHTQIKYAVFGRLQRDFYNDGLSTCVSYDCPSVVNVCCDLLCDLVAAVGLRCLRATFCNFEKGLNPGENNGNL